MKTIYRFFLGHLLVAVAALAAAFAIPDAWWFSLGVVFFGGLWFAANRRGVGGLGSLLLFAFLLSATVGFLIGAPAALLLLTALGALGAWDLDQFLNRLRSVERVEYESGLGRDHLRRLLLVEGIGLLAGGLALTVRFALAFWWIVLLALLAVIGISRVVAFVRKETE